MEELKSKPGKKEARQALDYTLAMVVTKTTERILIGPEDMIKACLEGNEEISLLYDETRPFGAYLLSVDTDLKGEWNTAISFLLDAQELIHKSPISRMGKKIYAPDVEGPALDILSDKFDSGNPIYRFTAMRIWYGYWAYRGNPDAHDCTAFLHSMHNLARPFSYPTKDIEVGVRLTSSNGIFRNVKELYSVDREQHIYHIHKTGEDCVFVRDSLIPLEKYYISRLEKWTKCIIRCRICNRLFVADSLRYELCSDECRDQARANNLESYKLDEDTSDVDRICKGAAAYWYNRLTRMKDSGEYSEEDIRRYTVEKDWFLKEKRQKRKAYKKGEITYTQLRDWLLQQEVRAQNALESIWLHKGDTAGESG